MIKAIGVGRSFFLARMLGPADYGTWMTLMLIVAYVPILSLGSAETLLKSYPFYIGGNDYVQAKRIENGVVSVLLFSSCAIIGISFFSQIVLDFLEIPISYLMMVRLMLYASAISCFSSFFLHRFAAHQEFKEASVLATTKSFISFLLLVGLGYRWGLRGTVSGFLISESVLGLLFVVVSLNKCGSVSFKWDFSLYRQIVRIGFPITLLWWIFVLQTSVDRGISMSMLGKTHTGYYSLGVSLVSLIILLPSAINRVLYPRVNEKMGESNNHESLAQLVCSHVRAQSLILPFFIGILILLAPLVYSFLPKYQAGLYSGMILIAGSFFVCLVKPSSNFLIATDRQNRLLLYLVFSLLLNVILSITCVRLGLGISGIALSTSLSAFVLSSLILVNILLFVAESNPLAVVKQFLSVLLPLLHSVAFALLLCYINYYCFEYSYLLLGISLCAFVMLYIGFGLLPSNRRVLRNLLLQAKEKPPHDCRMV